MVDLVPFFDDLVDESRELDNVVSKLTVGQWSVATPATGWTIAHQVAHLAWTDMVTTSALAGTRTFIELAREWNDGVPVVDNGANAWAQLPPVTILETWRQGRLELQAQLREFPADGRMPWFGTTMRPVSAISARIMETWAHGTDVFAALGMPPSCGPRLKHVADLAIRTRAYAFALNNMPIPTTDLRVVLRAPDDSNWVWGSEDAADRVEGSALDFCLLATRRINRADTDLRAIGTVADRWLSVIQAYAGSPGPGRQSTHR